MRNNQVSEEKLTEEIDFHLGKDVEEFYRIYEERNKEAFETGAKPIFSPIVDYLGLDFMSSVAFAYTRGDSLESIDKNIMQPAVERLLRACDEIDKRNMRGIAWFWEVGENPNFGEGPHVSPPRMASVFTFYAWLLCFGTPRDQIETLSNFVAPAGHSISVDTVIQHFQPDREIGDNNSQKSELFTIWAQMYTLKGDEQIAVIKDYLDNWARYLTSYVSIPFSALATYLNMEHKSNKTLVKELQRNKHIPFFGHWVWEVVLAVKLCNVDDTEFRDHPLYPVEAVDYIKS